MRTTLTTAALCAALLAAPCARDAFAQDEDAEITRMAKEHYKLGQDAFKAGRYPEAIKELKKAYLLKRLPPLLVNIAKTYEKLNDPDNAIYYYKKYLAETPPDAKDRDTIKQAIADVEAAKSGNTAAPAEEAPPPEAPPPRHTRPASPEADQPPAEAPPPPRHAKPAAPPADEATPPADDRPAPETAAGPAAATPAVAAAAASEWNHTPIDAVPPGRPVDVRVQTPVMKGVKVVLYYRGPGQAEFTAVVMKRHGGEKIARIPADMLAGKSIQYYIEAKDRTGNVLKNSGSQTDPNIVMIDASAKPMNSSQEGEEAGDEEGGDQPPQVEQPPARPKHNIDDERPTFRSEDDEPPPLGGPAPETRSGNKSEQKGKSPFTTLGWVGVGLAAGGVAGIASGVGLLLAARNEANAVAGDACTTPGQCAIAGQPYIFNDPGASPNDADFQYNGHMYNLAGEIILPIGGVLTAAGIACITADIIMQKAKNAPPPKKHHVRHRTVQDQPPTEAAPPSDDRPAAPPETSSIRNFMVSPIISPTTAGVGAGFSF